MVLVSEDGLVLDSSSRWSIKRFLEHVGRLESTLDFVNKKSSLVPLHEGLLYVDQHEYAHVLKTDPCVHLLGSDDATTCHVLVMESEKGSAMVHLDEAYAVHREVERMANVFNDDVVINVHIVGGFEDDRQLSSKLTLALINALVLNTKRFVLKVACVGAINTTRRRRCGREVELQNPRNTEEDQRDDLVMAPVVYGCCIDVRSGEIYPATFERSEVPDLLLRRLRCTMNRTPSPLSYNIYENQAFIIHPFEFVADNRLDMHLQLPDDVLLQFVSTSPDVEPDHFVPEWKEAIKLLIDNPRPLTTIFKGNAPRVYRRSTSKDPWLLQKMDSQPT